MALETESSAINKLDIPKEFTTDFNPSREHMQDFNHLMMGFILLSLPDRKEFIKWVMDNLIDNLNEHLD